MSFAQTHLRSAVYSLATESGPITDRLRVVVDPLSNLAMFNLNDIPSQLQEEFHGIREDLSDALRAQTYPEGDASELARRIVRLYEKITDLEQAASG